MEDYQRETPSVEHGGDRHVDHAGIIEIIRSLDESYRVPLLLFYTEDLSYKEIAKTLDIPIGTVMTRLSRGRDQVRNRLNKAGQGAANIIKFKGSKKRIAGHE